MKFNREEWVNSLEIGDVVQSRYDSALPIVSISGIELAAFCQSGTKIAYTSSGRTVWIDSSWIDRIIANEP